MRIGNALTAASLLWGLASITAAPRLHAGAPEDGRFSLVAYAGGGLSRYIAASGGPPAGVQVDYGKWGIAGTARVMWYPDHRIRVGVETGWAKLYSYDFGPGGEGRVHISAFPLIPVWSMNVMGIDLFAGAGYYILNSRLDYRGDVTVHNWSLGWLAAASYTYRWEGDWGIAGELKWMNVAEHQDAALTLQIQMVWKFFEW